MPEVSDPPTVIEGTIATPGTVRTRQPAFPPQVKSLAKSLFLEGFSPVDIQAKILVPAGTVRKWSQRDKWYLFKDSSKPKQVQQKTRMSVSVMLPTVSEQSSRVRNVLGAVVERQAQALAASQPSLNDLLNTPARQGHTAALKTLADAAATVFDWDSQHTPGIVLVGDIERMEPSDPTPIDVQSSVGQLSEPTNTTIGSVPEA